MLPKLLIVENSRNTTGAFKSALAISQTMRDDFAVEWVLPADASRELSDQVELAGFAVHHMPMRELGRSWRRLAGYLPTLASNAIRLRRLLAKRGADVLMINDYYNLLGAVIKGTGWRGRLLTYVRLLPANQQPLLNRLWVWAACRFSDAVIAVSGAVKRQLPQFRNVVLIYDPPALTAVSAMPVPENPSQCGKIRFLYLANYIQGKGHATALAAFAVAHAQRQNLALCFVGSDMGLAKNADLKSQLEDEAQRMGLDRVVCFKGFVGNVAGEIAAADVVLNFSESESFSRTCLEACFYSRPVIATRCGGPEEIIENGVSGFLVPVGDVPAMSTAMLQLADDANMRNCMGKAGAEIVRARFSEERFLAEFLPFCGAQ